MDIAGPGEDTFRSLDPLDKQAAQRKVAEIGQTFSLSTSSDVESASIGSIETVESEVLAGPPQPGPSLGQRFAAFFGGLTAGDAAERQGFIADMRKVFEGGKITSDHIDYLMKAYRGRVDGAEQLLRDIASPGSQAFANLEEPALGEARSKSAKIIALIPGILSSSEEEFTRLPLDANFEDLRVGEQQSSVSTSTSSRTSGRSQFNLLSSFSLFSLGDSSEFVPLKGGEAQVQDDLFSVLTTTGIGASSLAAAEAATSTFKVSPSFIQRIFGRVDTKAIEGQVEEFANKKVDSKKDELKEHGKAAFGNFLEDPNAELAKKLEPIDLLADQDSAKALLELIGKDQHEPLIGLLTEIDGWINEMKVGADRTRDKAAIEKAAVDVLGDRLGDLLFGNGEAVKAKVGLTKEVVAEFLVQHRATIIKIASEETV